MPETAKERLSEILIREYDVDIRVDTYEFATFFTLMMYDCNFQSMPWIERENYLKESEHINVSEKTLRKWCNKLISTETIQVDKKQKTFWRTWFNGDREMVEPDDKYKKLYWQDFWKIREEDKDKPKENQRNIGKVLWSRYGCCYYSCPTFIVNAFDEKEFELFQEIIELTDEISMSYPTATVIKTENRLVDVPLSTKPSVLTETADNSVFVF